MKLLLVQGLRHHRQKPLQTLLTLLGIAAGVALLCSMRLSQSTAERAFDRAVEAVAGAATHTVKNGPEGMPASAYAELRRRLGGRGVAPSMHAIARVPERDESTVLRVLGIDPFGDVELRPWTGPRAGGVPVGRLVTEPGAFLATQALLDRLQLRAGDELAISVGGRPEVARCLGALAPPSNVAAGLADTLVVDVATVQEWTERTDRVDRFDLQLVDAWLPPGMDVARAEQVVRDVCGRGVRIERAGSSQRGLAQLTRGFRINVTALSLLSLLVGAFLVHETMRLSVVARRGSFGVLRALGAPGRRLGLVVALEALVLGLLGSAIGAALGVAAADILLEPIVRTLNDHYATFALPTLEVDVLELLLASGGGVLVTVLAALGPAITASRVSPREVLMTAPGAAPGSRSWPWWWALPPAAVAFALLATVGTRLIQGYLGMLCLLIAAVLLMPTLMTGALRLLSLPLLQLGPFARYVARSTAAAREHLALPVAAMVLAVATTIGMAVLVTSFRGSVDGWLGQVLPADIYVSVPGGIDERSQVIAPELVAAMHDAPGVSGCTDYHRTVLPVRAGDADRRDVEVVGMAATDLWLRSWPILDGDRDAACAALADAGQPGVWVSEPLAFRCGLSVGDDVTIGVEEAAATLPVVAIYRDYSSERGELLVARDWLFRAGVRTGVTALGMEMAPGHDLDESMDAMRARAAAAADQGVMVRSTRDLKQTSLEIFDRTFAITGVMRLLCLAVAFFGIYSAFSALQFERGAEVGLLRCLGATPGRVGVVVIGQTALLGACAALLAMPLGVVVGQLLAHVINKVSFGWSLVSVQVPAGALVEASVLAVVASLLAGLWPAARFAKMRPANALRES